MSANEGLHRPVDGLPEADWPIASRFLHFLGEGGGDGPLSEGDWAAIREGYAEIARIEFVGLDELKRAWFVKFGLIVAKRAAGSLRRLDRDLKQSS